MIDTNIPTAAVRRASFEKVKYKVTRRINTQETKSHFIFFLNFSYSKRFQTIIRQGSTRTIRFRYRPVNAGTLKSLPMDELSNMSFMFLSLTKPRRGTSAVSQAISCTMAMTADIVVTRMYT